MSTVENRTEILRRDCPHCKGKGYTNGPAGEELCPEGTGCGGVGMLEREVAFKFDGPRSPEELEEIWGVSAAEIKDEGHHSPRTDKGGADD